MTTVAVLVVTEADGAGRRQLRFGEGEQKASPGSPGGQSYSPLSVPGQTGLGKTVDHVGELEKGHFRRDLRWQALVEFAQAGLGLRRRLAKGRMNYQVRCADLDSLDGQEERRDQAENWGRRTTCRTITTR